MLILCFLHYFEALTHFFLKIRYDFDSDTFGVRITISTFEVPRCFSRFTISYLYFKRRTMIRNPVKRINLV